MTTGICVGMNLLWCVPGVGGSEEYLIRQLDGMSRISHRYDVVVFAPRGFSQRHPDLAQQYEIREAPSDCRRREVRIMLEHTWLRRATRSMDLVHHGGGTMPKNQVGPSVLTIHDVQWCDYPEYVTARKLAYLRRIVPSSIRRASRIAVPSHFVASTLTKYFATHESRVSVVRHGLQPHTGDRATPPHVLREKFGLGDRRVVSFPAITHPHKNHRFLLELMSTPESGWDGDDLVMVFAGGVGGAEEEIARLINQHRLGQRVVRPGRISSDDRDGLLLMSDAMVFPSQYEGFGAPLIEAMRLGCPVIASDCGSIPEVVADGGIIAPLDVSSWSHALDELGRRRRELVALGHARADVFTSVKSAHDLIDCYDKALS